MTIRTKKTKPAKPAKKAAPRRARASATAAKRPKHGLGARVATPHDDVGAIVAMFATLADAERMGFVRDAESWLNGLSVRPRTRRDGIWCSVELEGGGAGLFGELDLRPAGRKGARA